MRDTHESVSARRQLGGLRGSTFAKPLGPAEHSLPKPRDTRLVGLAITGIMFRSHQVLSTQDPQ